MTRRPRAPRAIAASTRLSGLQLVIESPTRRALIPGLALEASVGGLDVVSPTGRGIRHYPWESVTTFEADRCAPDATGTALQVLEISAGGPAHRFLVPAADLAQFLADASGSGFGTTHGAMPVVHGAAASPARRHSRRGAVARGWRGRPRHASRPRVRPAPVAAVVAAFALAVTGITAAALGGGASAANITPSHQPYESIMGRMAHDYGSSNDSISLPAAAAPPEPAPPSLADSPALSPHEIFGFAPYWTLDQARRFDLKHLTTLAYFSVGVNGDGTIDESGPGWSGYESQDLADLVTRAHAAGDRVVLTATCFDQSALDQLTSSPASAATLAVTLVGLVGAKNLDGTNLDFEGQGNQDQQGLDHLVSQVSAAMHKADSHYQVTMDTYASSAGAPSGFFDIAGLAPSLDAFFVMAYDMNDFAAPSATSPLTGPGFSDLDAVRQYTAVVPPSKVILGVPYYGYDWPTAGPGIGDPATGPPTPITYSALEATSHAAYWDPVTQTPWTSFQLGTQWYQTWMDDPTSLALKAQLAAKYHIAGLGIWALGMDGNSVAELAALLGDAPVVKDSLAGPGPTTTTAPPTPPPATPPPTAPPASTTTAPPTPTTAPTTTPSTTTTVAAVSTTTSAAGTSTTTP